MPHKKITFALKKVIEKPLHEHTHTQVHVNKDSFTLQKKALGDGLHFENVFLPQLLPLANFYGRA